MRLARLEVEHRISAVVATIDGWTPIADILQGIVDPSDTIEALERLPELRHAIELPPMPAEVDDRFRAPVGRPGKVICIGLNYRDHIAEVGATPPAVPLVFAKWPTSLQGPRGRIQWRPDITKQLDYEVELALVIGEPGRDVEVSDARRLVAGYAVANDVSAREVQFAETQWVRSKSFDGACPLGPWITTADEVPDPESLNLTTEVNGEIRQSSNTSQLLFGIDQIVSFVSQGTTLVPGDIILTGTPFGVAMGHDGWFLQPGDVVRCEVDGLGVLEHIVTDWDV